MTETKYNGWTNRSSWLVCLHLTNEQETDREARELVRTAYTDDLHDIEARFPASMDNESPARSYAADILRDWVWNLIDEQDLSPLVSDLVHTALWQVNWREIADAFLDE